MHLSTDGKNNGLESGLSFVRLFFFPTSSFYLILQCVVDFCVLCSLCIFFLSCRLRQRFKRSTHSPVRMCANSAQWEKEIPITLVNNYFIFFSHFFHHPICTRHTVREHFFCEHFLFAFRSLCLSFVCVFGASLNVRCILLSRRWAGLVTHRPTDRNTHTNSDPIKYS